jgi:hypothetical protein
VGTALGFLNHNFFHGRIDHHLNNSWRIEASARYFRQLGKDATQLSIANGNPTALRDTPTRQNFESIALSGVFSPNLTAEFRFGRARQRWSWDTLRPVFAASQLGITGTRTSDGAVPSISGLSVEPRACSPSPSTWADWQPATSFGMWQTCNGTPT